MPKLKKTASVLSPQPLGYSFSENAPDLKRSAFYLLFCRHFVFHLAVSIYAQAH
jgi:hypothetical protein